MPPLHHSITKPTPMIVKHHAFHIDEVGARILSPNASILSSPQKTTENEEFVDSPSTKMKRSLRFHDTTSILWIESTENMSNKEIYACYYNSRDYSCFRDRERRISRNLSIWSFMKGDRNRDLIGVESRLQRFYRRERSRNAVFSVILEQELRQENGDDSDSMPEEDDLATARVYQEYTKESARLARKRATENALQVETTASMFIHTSRESMNEIEMEKGGEEAHGTMSHFELPWKIPAYTKKEQIKYRPTDMVKYTTCSHPILPSRYLEMLNCKEQDTSRTQPQESQDSRYEHQCKFQDRGIQYRSRRQEAPVQQNIVRAQEHHNFGHFMPRAHTVLQTSQQLAATKQSRPGTFTREWVWNPIPCDAVSPTNNVPKMFPWNAY